MSRQNAIGLIFILVAVFALWHLAHKKSRPADLDVETESSDENPTDAATETKTAQDPSPATPSGAAPGAPAPQLAGENFLKSLQGLQTCLSYQNSLAPGEGDPSIENWTGALQLELGEPVLRADDWTSTEILAKNGERRRIRLESEMTDDNRVVKRLKYSSLDKDDLPVPIPLPTEQTEDPNDAFVASLESEGEVKMVEKAQRLYFQDGSEAFAIERNNVVTEIDITRNGKSYHCWGLEQSALHCECQ